MFCVPGTLGVSKYVTIISNFEARGNDKITAHCGALVWAAVNDILILRRTFLKKQNPA